jgi:hypothetical protein
MAIFSLKCDLFHAEDRHMVQGAGAEEVTIGIFVRIPMTIDVCMMSITDDLLTPSAPENRSRLLIKAPPIHLLERCSEACPKRWP